MQLKFLHLAKFHILRVLSGQKLKIVSNFQRDFSAVANIIFCRYAVFKKLNFYWLYEVNRSGVCVFWVFFAYMQEEVSVLVDFFWGTRVHVYADISKAFYTGPLFVKYNILIVNGMHDKLDTGTSI